MGFASVLLIITAHLVTENPLECIYCLLPRVASTSLFAITLLLVRAVASAVQQTSVVRNRKLQRFGRKSLLITGSSFLFAASCVYRAINIADEGAFLCRGAKTLFNAPAAGRAVATVGELALVVQLISYIEDTARRLAVSRPVSSATIVPAIAAECCSWLGVLTGISSFFCLEYTCWVAIAAAWAWDAAELLHKSNRRGDGLVHGLLVAASLGLAGFNLLHEMPHFFAATPLNAVGGAAARPTPFSCTQDADHPIWHARLPFFVMYYVGANACSAFLTARYHLRGGAGSGAVDSLWSK